MPVVRIESSIPLPPQTTRVDALNAVKDCIVRKLGSKPVQVRVGFYAVDAAEVMVEGETGAAAGPWIFALAHIHEGRDAAGRAAFVADLLSVLAGCYGVEERWVKVLVQEFTDADWGFGKKPAAAASASS
jgi:phenylpyruvate tautomerase PptA (4-oxalocrotonate tautomerase family)